MYFNFVKLARFLLIKLLLVKMRKTIEGYIVQMQKKSTLTVSCTDRDKTEKLDILV